MTSKERVLTALNHRQPDRVPIFATLTPQVAQRLSHHLQLPFEPALDSLLSTRISHSQLLTQLGNDCVGIAACAPTHSPTQTLENGIIVNEWGMRFKNAGLYNEFYEFPLAHAETEQDINSYPFIDPYAPGRFQAAKETVARYSQTHAVVADLECSLFETAWYLTGLEKFLFDLMCQTPYINPLLDRIEYINTETGKELIRMGADVIWCGDDFGTQTSLIMDPDTWRLFFKPRIKRMFEAFRQVNPSIKIAWHSCGAVGPLIPDFIEVGLDILNPLQPAATGMDPEKLKLEYGKDLCFFGAICVQDLLPNQSADTVKSEVKRIARILGKNGGYMAAPAHNIQPDTPIENILAVYEALNER